MQFWSHQQRGVEGVLGAVARGVRRVLLTSPTGGGKTRMLTRLAEHYLEQGRKVVVYTNRKLLVEQTSKVLAGHGLSHGVRAAGYDDDRHRDLQVSSLQTERARKGRWGLHEADLVLVDEAHLQKATTAQEVMAEHVMAGAAVVGLTATPLGLAELYDELVVAGTVSELRACGALVLCHHHGPDEPDLRKIGKVRLGEDLSESQNVLAMMVPGIFGRVLEWWRRLNPEGKPTILFGPSVGSSLWFAEQFWEAGISAAHIDGEEVWVNGVSHRSNREVRAEVLAGSKDGRVKVLCNRFVLREGIDAPWLGHGIFATVFGSLQSYMQSGGRLLRASPGKAHVTLQDHGGNWWRHGSLNADREWRLELTEHYLAASREDAFRRPAGEKPQEPVRCPVCCRILNRPRCFCGWELKGGRKSRPVVQADGTLLEHEGDVFRPRRICQRADGPRLWERMYHRSKTARGARTFRAAAALFAYENHGELPDPAWPFMPREPQDWYRHVGDVPREKLR